MFKNKLQKRHHKMDQPGFKKILFPTFFLKSRGHWEGSDFQPFVRGLTPLAQIRTAAAGGVYPPRAKIVLLLLGGYTPPGRKSYCCCCSQPGDPIFNSFAETPPTPGDVVGMVGNGRPWLATVGHDRARSATVGHGRSWSVFGWLVGFGWFWSVFWLLCGYTPLAKSRSQNLEKWDLLPAIPTS